MSPSKIVVCPHCHRPNRLPEARLGDQGRCGHCQSPLFDGTPIALTDSHQAAVGHAMGDDLVIASVH